MDWQQTAAHSFCGWPDYAHINTAAWNLLLFTSLHCVFKGTKCFEISLMIVFVEY